MLGDYVLKRDDPGPGIFKVSDPVMLGIALWAAAHLLANGNVAGILLFGSLLSLAVGEIAHIERKRRASGDPAWQRFTKMSSIVPFAAILAGRNRFSFTDTRLGRACRRPGTLRRAAVPARTGVRRVSRREALKIKTSDVAARHSETAPRATSDGRSFTFKRRLD